MQTAIPHPTTSAHPAEKGNEIHAMSIDNLQVTAKTIAAKTHKELMLSKLLSYIQYGSWPSPVPDDILPFRRRKLELSISDGCIFWGKCVIIPKQFSSKQLKELHMGHVGVCQMKVLTCSHVW